MSLKARVPPDLIFMICGCLMWLVSRNFPQYSFSLPKHLLWFGLFLLAGFLLSLTANLTISRHRTTSRPQRKALPKATALITSGVFKYTRNPVYLGMAIMLLAWMIFLENWLSGAGIAIFLVVITRFQILAEEEALKKTFGDAYARYKKQVRRWI